MKKKKNNKNYKKGYSCGFKDGFSKGLKVSEKAKRSEHCYQPKMNPPQIVNYP